MKKVILSVIATLLVLLVFAQIGWLEIFGIHGIPGLFTKNNSKGGKKGGSTGFTAFVDNETGVSYHIKAEGDYFYRYEDGEWKKIFLVGVNIGAGEPGIFPGELSISYETYYRWFSYISEMNCNCIRVYTTMRPQFYMALNDYNLQSDNPLMLFQGVWMNEDDIERISDVYAENEKMLTDFKQDTLTLVDVIHGNATIEPTPGEASGSYVTDVSRWFGGWILGIEWDPNFVIKTNSQNPNRAKYDGTYLYTQTASPFEAFLCEIGDHLIKYETEKYKRQTTLAFTNWVTTDPLTHPDEPHADEDKVAVNVENIKSRKDFFPGMFASYHIYPYYPDSLNYQRDYLNNKDVNGKTDTYSAYLADLKLAHTMPILVSEFGVPTSRGMGHDSVMGYNQGHIDEKEQGKIISNLITSIINEKYAGAIIFTWQDEWFKRTWNNVMFDIADRRPFWSNIQTTEQCFGLLSFDPGEVIACYPDGDISDWKLDKPLIESDIGKLYVKSDERYVYIMLDADTSKYNFKKDTLYIPVDTIANQGNTKANDYNLTFDTGADFLIVINGEEDAHIYVDGYYDAFYYYFIESRMLSDYPLDNTNKIKDSGKFNQMLMCYGYNLKIPSTGVEVKDKAYETGFLKYGNGNPTSKNYRSLSDYCYNNGHLEIRIPWQLLNVMDPSTKMQMDDFHETQVIAPKEFSSFRFGFGVRERESTQIGKITLSGEYSYQVWNMPTWHERLKPAYYELKDYLSKLSEE